VASQKPLDRYSNIRPPKFCFLHFRYGFDFKFQCGADTLDQSGNRSFKLVFGIKFYREGKLGFYFLGTSL